MEYLCMTLVVIVTTLIGYYLNTPLPGALSDRWRLKFIYGWFKVAGLLAVWGGKIGYDKPLNITRKVFASFFAMTSYPVGKDGLTIENKLIDGVPVRIYCPDDVTSVELLPVIIYFHGGGMIMFSVDTYDNVLRLLSKRVRAVVIAPDYRLSPEHRYPAPLDDCVKVTRHVMLQAKCYSGDNKRVALAGDSAGGNFAASTALKMANTSPDCIQPRLQVLLYPMVQMFDFQLPSYNRDTFGSKATIAGAWYMYCTGKTPSQLPELLANQHTSPALKRSKFAQYVRVDQLDKSKLQQTTPDARNSDVNQALADEVESCVTDPYFSPLMASDFTQFPPSYVLTCEFDILRDEGLMFVRRLEKAGVELEHKHIESGWHGIVSNTRTNGGETALQNVVQFLKRRL